MKRYQITLYLLLSTTTCLSAQNFNLENGWKEDSKFLYSGVENRLFVKGNTNSIKNIKCSNATCKLSDDAILVYPSGIGPLAIDVYTEEATFTFGFDVVTLEYPQVKIISSSGQTSSTLSKSDIRKAVLNVGGTLFENYYLEAFVINVAGTKYKIMGSSFSEEVQKAFEILNPGDVIYIEQVALRNKKTNSSFKALIIHKFTIT